MAGWARKGRGARGAYQRLILTAAQRAELLAVRSHHAKRYVRERAAAVLQVADGKTIGEVARRGLIRPRQDETVSGWVRRYRAHGVAGLLVRAGGGRTHGQPLLRAGRRPLSGTN